MISEEEKLIIKKVCRNRKTASDGVLLGAIGAGGLYFLLTKDFIRKSMLGTPQVLVSSTILHLILASLLIYAVCYSVERFMNRCPNCNFFLGKMKIPELEKNLENCPNCSAMLTIDALKEKVGMDAENNEVVVSAQEVKRFKAYQVRYHFLLPVLMSVIVTQYLPIDSIFKIIIYSFQIISGLTILLYGVPKCPFCKIKLSPEASEDLVENSSIYCPSCITVVSVKAE